jgi:hypothetical protein
MASAVARTVLLMAVVSLAIAGCRSPAQAPTAGSQAVNSTIDPNRLIDLLKKLPTVKTVTPWPVPDFITDQPRPGLTVETRHYRIFTTLEDPLILRQVPIFLESAFASYAEMTASPIQPKNLLDVYLFKNREQWEEFTRSKTGPLYPVYQKIRSGAYCFEGVCVAYHLGRRSDFAVLAHEGWHQFNHALFQYSLPAWLDEGVATCFEAWQWRNERFSFVPRINGSRLIPLKKALIDGKIFPLEELIQLDPGMVLMAKSDGPAPPDDPDLQGPVQLYYAQLYALIRFVREDNYGRRLPELRKILDDAMAGRWNLPQFLAQHAAQKDIPLSRENNRRLGLFIFNQYLGQPSGEFENQYLAFCRKITVPVPIPPTPQIR